MKTSLILAGALMLGGTIAQAQMAAPATSASTSVAPADQAAPPSVTAAQPDAAAPAPAADATAATTTASASDGVTKEGSKYVKDGRPATRVEIATYKKAEKAHRE